MRNLLFLGFLAVAFLAFGCSSNPAGDIVGPTSTGTLSLPVQPSGSNLIPDGLVPPGAQAFFGEISNLSAGGFTLTRLDGQSFEVITNAETKVLSEGELSSDLSNLQDGMFVTAFGQVRGMPGSAPITAAVVVVSSAETEAKGGFWVVDGSIS